MYELYEHIAARLHQHLSAPPPAAPQRLVVLLTTGALNPVHRGHLRMLHLARAALEAAPGNALVLGGLLSPSADVYVRGKRLASWYLAADRVDMVGRAVAEDGSAEFLQCDPWESERRVFVDFPEVRRLLEGRLNEAFAAALGGRCIDVLYVCGQDHAEKCHLWGQPWVVCVTRAGARPPPDGHKCWVVAGDVDVLEASSTRIRDLLAGPGPDVQRLEALTYKSVVEKLLATEAQH